MKDRCVEFAQVYTNDEDAPEHVASIAALEQVLNELKKKETSYSLVVLVDDCSHPNREFDFDAYAVWLEKSGVKPDLVLRESQLTEACEELLEAIEKPDKEAEVRGALNQEVPDPSLFVATWYLLRLGSLRLEAFPAELQGERIINILPTHFKPDEEGALEIIRSTPHRELEAKIEYVYT